MTLSRSLHHFPLDPASRQVRLALGEKRLLFSEVSERYWEPKASLEAMNPSGLTPILVELQGAQRLVICESRAILEHLEEQYPQPDLLGTDPATRAEARRLVQWFERKFDNEVNAYILYEKMDKRLLGLGAPNLANLRQGRDNLRAHLAYLETLLANRDWLAGPRVSQADFAAAAHISVIDYFGDVPWREFSAAKTWYMKIKSRPCFRPLLADRWPGLAPSGHYDNLDF
jgi:glutathione S-transferase